MAAGAKARRIVTALLLGLCFVALAQAQTGTDTAESTAEEALTLRKDLLTGREDAANGAGEQYVNIPEVIAIGKRWRLDDEVKEQLWRAEQAQEERNLRERQYNERFKRGAVASAKSDGGRFKLELLPLYDPRDARVIDMGVDNSRSEVIDLFKGKF